MPLSEHEQKMLDEMERQLFADDPRLARAFAPKAPPRRNGNGRRILIGLGAVVVGLGVLVLAVSLPAVWLGVIAFIGMLAGAVYAVTAPSGPADGEDSPGGGGGGSGPASSGGDGNFMRKMEERWEKRAGDDPRL
ncbi:DUF3040 domain-containing protein [Brachybacterium sp. Z12]|uniref:DUF3040 domain-containing protein n=1 Tax=Brachybacterium sp. Z12 TaxID=2759167 RepID=UPI001861D3F6|nr:DUF3040 domain-containing protein [Brachybacterium sp. Z12]QNN83170.1 DUF3040 domain-containing protein [Brachybacterium sp. Z12]